MRQTLFYFIFALAFVAGLAADPKLGYPSEMEASLNQLPAISIAGKNIKFEFGGNEWISKVDGKNLAAGTFTSAENEEGNVLTLKQTHIYSDKQKPIIGGEIGWVKASTPDLVLNYKKGPPPKLSLQ